MGRRTRNRAGRAPLATVVLALLAALSACGGGDDATPSPPPSPTPAETSAPTVMATPEPPATATPTSPSTAAPTRTPPPSPTPEPTPCDGFECLEPAPYRFEHGVWEPGERVDWESGAFVLETLTGRIHGYRAVPRDGGTRIGGYQVLAHGWIWARASLFGPDRQVLIDRKHERVWWWPDHPNTLAVAALSDDHVLFVDRDRHFLFQDRHADDFRYTLTTRGGRVRTQFWVPSPGPTSGAFFSPHGRALVVRGGGKVYRMSVTDSSPKVLFESQPPDGGSLVSLRVAYSGPAPASHQLSWAGSASSNPGPLLRMLLVEVLYERPPLPGNGEEPRYVRELHLFDWEGVVLSEVAEPSCAGTLSPDGLYIAWQEESMMHGAVKLHGNPPPPSRPLDPVPSVVIADAETCQPIARVLSAYSTTGPWDGQWLSSSGGLVIGVSGGYAVARLHPRPHLVDLPSGPPGGAPSPGPVPAPTGDGRYFAYHFPFVYDAHEGDWVPTASFPTHINALPDELLPDDFPFFWGETHEELYEATGFWDGWVFGWLLLSPKIELPPFDDPLNARVVRTGTCLNLRKSGEVLACLRDGTRVSLAREDVPTTGQLDVYGVEGTTGWIYVRTEDGLEGWVAHEYLEHD